MTLLKKTNNGAMKKMLLLAGLFLLTAINIKADDVILDEDLCLSATMVKTTVDALVLDPISITMLPTANGQTVLTITPNNALLDKLTWTNSNEAAATITVKNNMCLVDAVKPGKTTITVTSESGKSATCQITVYERYTYNSNRPKYFELDGIKWSTLNVGATNPEDAGKFFTYGTPDGYTASEGHNFIESNYTAYDSDITPGDKNHDGASKTLGSTWIMPTSTQWEGLVNNADVEKVWIDGETTIFENTTATGWIYKEKDAEPTSGKFIFIPASGYYVGTTLTEATTAGAAQWCAQYNTAYNKYDGLTIRPIYTKPTEFSVSGTTKVEFSPGNLQYQASTTTWRFAANQYSYVGNAAGNTTKNDRGAQTAWIDLFGWGTGENPTTIQEYGDKGDKYTYPWIEWGTAAEDDLGTGWRTLTSDEWSYLLSTRSNATQLRSLATVCNQHGLILLPDEWEWPEEITEWSTGTFASYTTYTFNSTTWDIMEDAGAIFLPAAGIRKTDPKVENVDANGYYWSSTIGKDANKASYMMFTTDKNINNALVFKNDADKVNGYSVRLVKNAQ